jgi:hypothetical protein
MTKISCWHVARPRTSRCVRGTAWHAGRRRCLDRIGAHHGEEPIVVGAVRYLDYAGEEMKDRSMLAVFFISAPSFLTRPKSARSCHYKWPSSSLCQSPMTESSSRSTRGRWCNKCRRGRPPAMPTTATASIRASSSDLRCPCSCATPRGLACLSEVSAAGWTRRPESTIRVMEPIPVLLDRYATADEIANVRAVSDDFGRPGRFRRCPARGYGSSASSIETPSGGSSSPRGPTSQSGVPELAGHAIGAGLVDECHLFLCPIVVEGGKRALPDNVRAQPNFSMNASSETASFTSTTA